MITSKDASPRGFTFETEEDFQKAVMCVIAEKLGIRLSTYGDHFVQRVEVALYNTDDDYGVLSSDGDACS